MPELPEIETIRRDLEKTLLMDQAIALDVRDSRLMSNTQHAQWQKRVLGQSWLSFARRGKYLWANLESGWRVFFHMRMTGQLLIGESGPRAAARMHIRFKSGKILSLCDQRRFAETWLLDPDQVWHTNTPPGPDALTELTRDQFVLLLKTRSTKIQPLLMDQRLMAGVGNIYAQEALFKAAIRPTRASRRISRDEANRLFGALRDTLETAIDHRGSTSRNYRDAFGKSGSAQSLHDVYRKGGSPCPRCGRTLRAIRVGGRGSVFCSQCQK